MAICSWGEAVSQSSGGWDIPAAPPREGTDALHRPWQQGGVARPPPPDPDEEVLFMQQSTESQRFIGFLMRDWSFTPAQVCRYLGITLTEFAQALKGEIEVIEVITSATPQPTEGRTTYGSKPGDHGLCH